MDKRQVYFDKHKDKLESFLQTVPDDIATSLFLRRFRDKQTSMKILRESEYPKIVTFDAMSNRFYRFVNYCKEPFVARYCSPIKEIYLNNKDLYDAYISWESKYKDLFDLYVKKFLSLLEIAEVFNTSCNNVSNWKIAMDKSFERYVSYIDISSLIDDAVYVSELRTAGVNTILDLIAFYSFNSKLELESLDIARLGFPIATYNKLKRSGINTINDLYNTTLCGGTKEVINGKWQNSKETNKVIDVLKAIKRGSE